MNDSRVSRNPKPSLYLAALSTLAVVALAGCGDKGGKQTEEELLANIQPVGKIAISAQAAPAAAPGAAAADAGPPDGKKIYDTVCMACHATGAAGAPKFGDKAAWAPRIKTGNDALYASALKGKNQMPPKGGNPALSDAAVKAAVDYMVSAAK